MRVNIGYERVKKAFRRAHQQKTVQLTITRFNLTQLNFLIDQLQLPLQKRTVSNLITA